MAALASRALQRGQAAPGQLWSFESTVPSLMIPSFSDGTEHLCEEGLGCEHLGEPLEASQPPAGQIQRESFSSPPCPHSSLAIILGGGGTP